MKDNFELNPAGPWRQPAAERRVPASVQEAFAELLEQADDDEDIVLALDAMPAVLPVARHDEELLFVGALSSEDASAPVSLSSPRKSLDGRESRGTSDSTRANEDPSRSPLTIGLEPAPATRTTTPAKPATKTVASPTWTRPIVELMANAVFRQARIATVAIEHPTLGELNVRVTRTDGAFNVEIAVGYDAGRRALQAEGGALHAAFADAGLRLARVSFSLRPARGASNGKKGGDHERQRHPAQDHE